MFKLVAWIVAFAAVVLGFAVKEGFEKGLGKSPIAAYCSFSVLYRRAADGILGKEQVPYPTRKLALLQEVDHGAEAYLVLGAFLSTAVCSLGYAANVYYVAGSSQKICQLTGEVDFGHPPVPTGNRTERAPSCVAPILALAFAGPSNLCSSSSEIPRRNHGDDGHCA